jgi:hypothetical protein
MWCGRALRIGTAITSQVLPTILFSPHFKVAFREAKGDKQTATAEAGGSAQSESYFGRISW